MSSKVIQVHTFLDFINRQYKGWISNVFVSWSLLSNQIVKTEKQPGNLTYAWSLDNVLVTSLGPGWNSVSLQFWQDRWSFGKSEKYDKGQIFLSEKLPVPPISLFLISNINLVYEKFPDYKHKHVFIFVSLIRKLQWTVLFICASPI